MKKISIFFYSAFLIFNSAFSQNPLVKQWDYRFGGTAEDFITCFQQTSDGGYILGGHSLSDSSGDKTEDSRGSFDYWIIKIDSTGAKQWDKDFGGTNDDLLYSLKQTADGGYILGGYSNSDSSGDKTRDVWGAYDYWIVKIDSLGNKQWDKDFGGTDYEYFYSIQQTADGGYILGGYSFSGISGDKSEPNWDSTHNTGDYWIVKIDSMGTKQWDKDVGGTKVDGISSLQQTNDGGYILGGLSRSGISGDKTEDTWGNNDYWIVKTDSAGTKQWDKDFGGTNADYFNSLDQTSDGGYIIGGYSRSGISGNKTQPLWGGTNDYDYWIVKIDSLGSMQWDKDFGGTLHEDFFGNISQTSDGGYLMAGSSYSPISGDKTENNLGLKQSWIIKTDSLGIKQWDKTLQTDTPVDDETGYAIQTREGCYAMANWTSAGIGGDKTQPSWGSYDVWIIKFCDTTLTTNLTPAHPTEKEISISPNPFTSEISITFQKQNLNQASISIKNILGQTIFSKDFSSEGKSSFGGFRVLLDLSFLEKGIYLVEVVLDGERMVRKAVKK